jgi:outer membrane protein OmpA-like peptidoglycan-associated protein
MPPTFPGPSLTPLRPPPAPAIGPPVRPSPPRAATAGAVRAGCPPTDYWPSPGRQQRRRTPDITGLYEQETLNGGQRMLLQLVTAGQAIAGWFTPPPAVLGMPQIRSWPVHDRDLPLPNRAGSFVVDRNTIAGQGEWLLWWDFDEAGVANRKDPHFLLASLLAAGDQILSSRSGCFRIVDATRPDVEVALRFDPRAREADVFRRYHASARLPWSYVGTVPDQASRNLYLVEHVQPLPPSWVAEIVESLTGANAKRRLEQWRRAPAGPARLNARETIATHLNLWVLGPNGLADLHRAALLTRIRAALASTRLSIDGEDKSFADWYAAVGAEMSAESQLREKNPSLLPFTRLGLGPSKDRGYAYVISLRKAKRRLDAVAVKGAVAGFSMRVRKIPVDFQLDPNGARIIDADGNPKLKDPKVLRDDKRGVDLSGGSAPLLIGAYLDLGAGLGMALDSGLSESEGHPSASVTTGGGDVLDSVTCYSDLDLTVEDFDGATFSIAAVKGPGVKLGNYLSLDVFSTRFHEYRLRGGKTLSAVITARLDLKPPSLPSLDLLYGGIEKIKSYVEGWTKGKASLTLFEVSQGHGILVQVGRAAPPRPAIIPGTPTYAMLQAASKGLVLFDVDSATLRAAADPLRDARAQLEVWLATVRALVTGAAREITITGFASPEAPRCHNEMLSTARAETVAYAVLDALENPAGLLYVVASGAGELPALASGLFDPPDDEAGRAAFIRTHQSEVARWPEWRKVELAADGDVVIIGYEAPPRRP